MILDIKQYLDYKFLVKTYEIEGGYRALLSIIIIMKDKSKMVNRWWGGEGIVTFNALYHSSFYR